MPAANETRKGSRLNDECPVQDKTEFVEGRHTLIVAIRQLCRECDKQFLDVWILIVLLLEFKKADDQVYVIFRFNQEDMLIVQNTCALQKKIIENYGGTVIGLVDKITIYECEQVKQGPEKALLLLEFNSEKSARLWLNSDPKFKQHDWPHVWNNVDVIILPLSYIPSADAKTFMLTEIKGKTASDFQEAYVANTAALLDKMNIEHGVVARRGIDCERGCWIQKNSFVLMHRAHSIEQMDNFYYSPEYEKLKQYRQAVCNTETMVFVAKGVTEK